MLNSPYQTAPYTGNPVLVYQELTRWGLLMLVLAAIIWFIDLNRPLFQALNASGQFFPDQLWLTLTWSADSLPQMALILLVSRWYPRLMVSGLLLLVLGTFCVQGLKSFFNELRPVAVLGNQDIQVLGPLLLQKSFPSGHSFSIFASAALLAFNFNRVLWIRLALGYALLAALSRVMVGAHWPIDTLVGGALGMFMAWICWEIADRNRWSKGPVLYWSLGVVYMLMSILLFYSEEVYPGTDLLAKGLAIIVVIEFVYRFFRQGLSDNARARLGIGGGRDKEESAE
jgi:membrane-associated phospholipid phosphatase